jgi:glutathionyl-hydroquinone reductase
MKPQFPDEQTVDGEFERQEDAFRQWITYDGSSPFPAVGGRYNLYVSLAFPWASRALIVHKLKRLSFINFTFSALLGPAFGARLVQMPEGDPALALAYYQAGFRPLLYGIVVVLILTFFLKETGPASRET